MKKYHLILLFFAVSFGLVSCSKDDDSAGSQGKAQVAIMLTDAPGDYEEVWVEVEDVEIKTSNQESDEEGWESLDGVKTGRVDLLELTGGVAELLVDTEVPAGLLHQIRLVLGDNNTIKVNNGGTIQELVLNTPSAEQSGLKITVDQELEANTQYTFILDFNVDKSVVATGNGGYNLKPVIRASLEEHSSVINGTVVGTQERVLVSAVGPAGDISAYTNAEGNFHLHGVPAGTYFVKVTPPADSGFKVWSKNMVVVGEEETVDLGEIILQVQ